MYLFRKLILCKVEFLKSRRKHDHDISLHDQFHWPTAVDRIRPPNPCALPAARTRTFTYTVVKTIKVAFVAPADERSWCTSLASKFIRKEFRGL